MKKTKTKATGAFGVLLLALAKLKWVIAILKFAKLWTVVSLLISLVSYGLVYGWKFGVAIIYLLLIHELGHYWACKKRGIPVKPTLFIPFIGAAVRPDKHPKNVQEQVFIAYMGPVFGLISVLPSIGMYALTEEPFWILLVVLGSMLNLFNLIPYGQLDGGQIINGIHPRLWILGLILLTSYVIYNKSVLGGLILILGILQLVFMRQERKELPKRKKDIAVWQSLHERLEKSNEEEMLETILKEYKRHEEDVVLNEIITKAEIRLSDGMNEDEIRRTMIHELNRNMEEHQRFVDYIESFDTINMRTRIINCMIYLGLVLALFGLFHWSNEIVHVTFPLNK